MRNVLFILGEFLTSAFRPGNRLARGIAVVLFIKVCVLVALKVGFFSGADAGAEEVAGRLVEASVVERSILDD